MGDFFLSTVFRSHRRLLYLSVVSFLLLYYFRSPQIRTSTLWSESDAPLGDHEALPYTAAIIYLAEADRVSELLESLASVNKNLPGHPWPIVLFHTGDFDHNIEREEFLSLLHNYLGADSGSEAFVGRIEFVRLDWQLPKGISSDKETVNPVDSHRWPNYHHMCSFFAREIFDHPRLRDVSYYMRMDTDSFFTAPLCYDPFDIIHFRRRSYGYLSTGTDPQEYTEGLMSFIHNYTQGHTSVGQRLRANNWEWSLKDADGDETLRLQGYTTNFEIVKLSAFRRPDVKEWLGALENYPEGIYKWRWGDAPLRYASVQMFFDVEESTEQLCGIRYSHQADKMDECPCVPLRLETHKDLLSGLNLW